jgi:DNA helicase-2/ATP-dependent DNA helicase PcrA
MVRVQEIDDELPDTKRERVEKFVKLIRHLQKRNREVPAGPLIKFTLDESGYKKFLDDGSIEGEARLENAAELISVASKYDKLEPGVSLGVFLEEVSLVSDLDTLNEKDNAVTLMTLHSAKGLEFPWVFICGLEEGLLPHSRSMLEPSELEEERRLFYVGCTRAMDRLYLLHTKNRMLYGESQTVIPSQFLDDLPPDFVQRNDIRLTERPARLTTIGGKPIPVEKPLQEFSDGDRVFHRTFGEGMVVSVMGGIVTVAFKNPQFGIKKLAITIAPLEKI